MKKIAKIINIALIFMLILTFKGEGYACSSAMPHLRLPLLFGGKKSNYDQKLRISFFKNILKRIEDWKMIRKLSLEVPMVSGMILSALQAAPNFNQPIEGYYLSPEGYISETAALEDSMRSLIVLEAPYSFETQKQVLSECERNIGRYSFEDLSVALYLMEYLELVALKGADSNIRNEAESALSRISVSGAIKSEECKFKALDHEKIIAVKTQDAKLKEEAIRHLLISVRGTGISMPQREKALFNLQEIVTGNYIGSDLCLYSGKGNERAQQLVMFYLYNSCATVITQIKNRMFSFMAGILEDDAYKNLRSNAAGALSIYMSTSEEYLEKGAAVLSDAFQDYFVTDIGFAPRDVWRIYNSDFVRTYSKDEKARLEMAFSVENCLNSHEKEISPDNIGAVGSFILEKLDVFRKRKILSDSTGCVIVVYDGSDEKYGKIFKSEAESFRDMAIDAGVESGRIKIAGAKKDAMKAIVKGRKAAKNNPFFLAFFNHGGKGAENDTMSIERFSLNESITADDIAQALLSADKKTGNIIIYTDACTSEDINKAILYSLDNSRGKEAEAKLIDICIHSSGVSQYAYVGQSLEALRDAFYMKFRNTAKEDDQIRPSGSGEEHLPLLGEDVLKAGLMLLNVDSPRSFDYQRQGVLMGLDRDERGKLTAILERCENRREKREKPRVDKYGKYPDIKPAPGTLKITDAGSGYGRLRIMVIKGERNKARLIQESI